MLKRLYLIRHGETEGAGDGEPRYKGSIDVSLSARGLRQTGATAAHMKRAGLAPDAIYASPLSRARATADELGHAFGLGHEVIQTLRERHFGLWEGMTFREIAARWPDAFNAWAADPLSFSPTEGESTREVHERALGAFYEIAKRHAGGSVAIVAHGGINRVLLCQFLGIPLEHIFRVEQDFACLNIVRFYDGGEPCVKLMNATYHEAE